MSSRIMVALGGNAILSKDASAEAQQAALRRTSEQLVEFVKEGNQLIVSHGNGPQVGNLLLQQAAGSTKDNPMMPIDTADAMTEGSVGYWLQNTLGEKLKKHNLPQVPATVVTQVVVDENDQSFENPTKPIGPFYKKDEIDQVVAKHPEFTLVEDAGRGYRRVVPSPKPVSIKEAKVINAIIESGNIPVAVGGGGVPVVEDGNRLVGKEAVIDKDLASEKLAEVVNADKLIMLTAVDNVFINYNKPNQQKLEKVTVSQLESLIEQKQFAPGSMLPKVQAAIDFVKNSKDPNAVAVITSLDNVHDYLQNNSGTIITK